MAILMFHNLVTTKFLTHFNKSNKFLLQRIKTRNFSTINGRPWMRSTKLKIGGLMGRTYRNRNKSRDRPISLDNDTDFVSFSKWISSKGWKPTFNLRPRLFPQTGRGLMTVENIPVGSTLVRLPSSLLVTVKTVSESSLGPALSNGQFYTQQVLATFILYEEHLGQVSQWFNYIRTLPKEYYSPIFSTKKDLKHLPDFIQLKVNRMETTIQKEFSMILKSFSCLTCKHCDRLYSDIFTYDNYKWAWFTVNSRCVYIRPEVNYAHDINLIDPNCLALAPYLDMINHSNSARVEAFFNIEDSTYNLITLVPFKKYNEVFIHYGSHNNEKLFLEYGFILEANNNDVVKLTINNFLSAGKNYYNSSNIYKERYTFLKSHCFFEDLYCNKEGLSWNAKVILYVMTSPPSVPLKTLTNVVFSGALIKTEQNFDLLNILFDEKINELKANLSYLETQVQTKPNIMLSMCIQLINEYVSILIKNKNI